MAARVFGLQRSVPVALATAVVAFAAYLPTLSSGFVNWDDVPYLTGNPHFGRFDLAFVEWSFTTWWYSNWHPLTWLSFGIDHAIWGMDPTGFHLTNVLLHSLDSFLVVLIAARLFARAGTAADAGLAGAAIVGAIFAVHPLHVESVAWVSERKDVLSGLFSLISIYAYLVRAEAAPGSKVGRRAYAVCLVAFALALMSKPMAVTLPVVFLILDAYPLGRFGDAADRMRVALFEKLPFYVGSLASAIVTIAAQSTGGAMELTDLGFVERLVVAETALGFYLAKFFWPVGLVPLYPLPATITLASSAALAALVAIVSVTAAAFALRGRAPVIAAAWAYYVVSLLPVIGLIKVGEQAAADRYMYLPILGPAFVVAAGATAIFAARPGLRRAVGAVALGIAMLLAARTHDQITVWKDSFSLWMHVIEAYPDSVTAHYNLGYSHYLAGDGRAARSEYERALELDPKHVSALNELGLLHSEQGSYSLAIRYLERVVVVQPDVAHYHANLAVAYEGAGNWTAARKHYERYLELASPLDARRIEIVRAKLSGH